MTTAVDNVAAAIAERCARQAAAPALVSARGTTSYAELGALLAAAGARYGDGEGPLVVAAARTPETIALVLGAVLAGRPVLVAPGDLRPAARAALTAELDAATVPDGTALILTTSGSTGFPKLVPLPHAAIERFMAWVAERFGIGEGTRVLGYAPLSFDLSLLEVWATLAHGGCVVLVAADSAAYPRYLLDLIAAHEVEVVQGVPMLYALLGDGGPLPSVRHAILTGDAPSRACVRGLPALLPNARLWNVYGCTETNDSFIGEIDPADDVLPIGEPLPGVEACVAGDGELWVSTPFQSTGYLGRAAGNGRFGADGWFRTGDLVARDARGRLVLRGRTDHQVKVRGVRVNLEDVERAVADCPGVAEAAVVALPDPLAGRRLHAVVRARPGTELSSLALRESCARSLSAAAMPAAFRLVGEPLPRTTTGKVDRAAVERAITKEGS